MAKKSIESGEDCDGIPESMRNYLAMQAMESGKSLGGNFLGRSSMMPYGHGPMVMGGDQNGQGKVGKSRLQILYAPIDADLNSHTPPLMSFTQCWIMEACWSEHDGPDRVLLSGEGMHDILYQ